MENNIRGGISSVMGDRYIQSDVNKQILYNDANNLYGWAMSQCLSTGEFENYSFVQYLSIRIIAQIITFYGNK